MCRADACSQQYTIAYLEHENNKTKNKEVEKSANVWKVVKHYENDRIQNSMIGFYTADGPIYYMVPRMGYGSDTPKYRKQGVIFMVDVNGNKGPNIQNVDLFTFVIDYNGKIDNWAGNSTDVLYLMSNGWKMDY